ncbi:MAG: NYN domain-containing protein [Candidatus Melainabacteria bacterium]|nr:NYN domain-containing protein [Candidatus Melainabacteria bacterium]
MKRDRVISLIDGFNLYHAIARLNLPYLKWIDLQALSGQFILKRSEDLVKVYYFSTIASHMPPAVQQRQTTYIRALKLTGVQAILGQFKKKSRYCSICKVHYIGYEEKETDVNIALTLFDLANEDQYDRAMVISNDSDLAPAIKKVLERFPNKKITIVAPPLSRQCNELLKVATDKAIIKQSHLERCLLPRVVYDASRIVSANRPMEYDPVSIAAYP